MTANSSCEPPGGSLSSAPLAEPPLVTGVGPRCFAASRYVPLSRGTRWGAIVIGLTLWGLLGVASQLAPDPRGHGTHQQLGLPPCTFLMLFHRPCPSCGMTTAWSHLLHADVKAALGANVAGTIAAVLAAPLGGWFIASAWRGCWLGGRPDERLVFVAVSTLAAIMLLDWCRRLF